MKTTKSMIQRAKRFLLGRGMRRLAGDRTGAVMMEYVIVAVLIAAAAVVAVTYFGKTIKNQFTVSAKAAAGQSADAVTQQGEAEKTATKAVSEGKEHANAFSDKKE